MELKTLLKNTKKVLAILNKYLIIALHFINAERIKLAKKIRKEWIEYSDQLAYELVYYYEILKPKFKDFRKNWKKTIVYFYYNKYAEIHVNKALNLISANIRWFFTALAILVMLIGFIGSYDNRYHSILFYADKNKNKLLAEKRAIIKANKKIDRIKNSVEELLLGPIDPKLVSVFPKESRLISAMLSNKTLILDFNKETIMDVNWEKNNGVSIYYLLLQSVTDSVCFQFKEIEKIKFYFNGQDYRYIGDIGPVNDGVKPDWKILKK